MAHTLKKISFVLIIAAALLIALFFLGVVWPLKQIAPTSPSDSLAFTHIAVIDIATGQIHRNQTIVINQHTIQQVAASDQISLPSTTQIIDATGQFAIPSLWDMHTHIYQTTPLIDLPLYIAYGVTNVRDMMSCPKTGDPFAPCPSDLKGLSRESIAGTIIGPRVQGISSWMANGAGIHDYVKGLPDYFGVETPKQARQFVQHFAGQVDAIKVYNYIPRKAYFALADEAKKLDIDVVGHRPFAISAIEAARTQKSIEHARFILHESFAGAEELRAAAIAGQWQEHRQEMLDQHDTAMAGAIFAAMRESGTYYVPTHLTRRINAYADTAEEIDAEFLPYLHPLLKWQWLEDINKSLHSHPATADRKTYKAFYQKGLELTGKAHSAGVKVLAGTDYTVGGITLHQELEQLTLAGLTPLEALQAATVLPAEYFNLENHFGKIAPGFTADLIILERNPLENIRNTQSIAHVIFNGAHYDSQKINTIKAHVQKRARSFSVACKIIWRFIKSPASY